MLLIDSLTISLESCARWHFANSICFGTTRAIHTAVKMLVYKGQIIDTFRANSVLCVCKYNISYCCFFFVLHRRACENIHTYSYLPESYSWLCKQISHMCIWPHGVKKHINRTNKRTNKTDFCHDHLLLSGRWCVLDLLWHSFVLFFSHCCGRFFFLQTKKYQ